MGITGTGRDTAKSTLVRSTRETMAARIISRSRTLSRERWSTSASASLKGGRKRTAGAGGAKLHRGRFRDVEEVRKMLLCTNTGMVDRI
eukprot:768581-Hanusia_phi.AAC.6